MSELAKPSTPPVSVADVNAATAGRLDEARALISRLEELRTGELVDFDAVQHEVRKLVSLVPASMGSLQEPGLRLYRVTRHHRAIPGRIDEIWFPPPEATRLNRANRPGVPMFYCSSDPRCAIQESALQIGDLIVSATWVTTDQMILHALGYDPQVFARSRATRQVPDRQIEFLNSLNDVGQLVRGYIGLSFTDPTPGHHRVSCAIAEVHRQEDSFAGILYPSVTRSANCDNLALEPSFVRRALRVESAQFGIIDKLEDPENQGLPGGTILADMSESTAAGELRWKYREPGFDIPPQSCVAVEVGKQFRSQSACTIASPDGATYNVEPGYLIDVLPNRLVIRDALGVQVPPK